MLHHKDRPEKSHQEKSREPQIAHAEAALGAGRKYENAGEGHNKMYDTFEELQQQHKSSQENSSSHESRGARIDRELEQEDTAKIRQMDAHRQAKEEP